MHEEIDIVLAVTVIKHTKLRILLSMIFRIMFYWKLWYTIIAITFLNVPDCTTHIVHLSHYIPEFFYLFAYIYGNISV